MEKILSVIIPAYNVEMYIKKCLETFNQLDKTYKEKIEIIVVNDGSTDSTENIVLSYIRNKEIPVILINKENGGHGSAINKGIECSVGKYLKVIDGDDWIVPSEFEILIKKLIEVDVDIIITDYTEQHIYNNSTKRISWNYYKNKILEIDKLNERIQMHSLVYKSQIFKKNNIKITEKIFYVDMEYTLFPLAYAKDFIYLDLDIYQYFLGRKGQSVSLDSFLKNIDHHMKIIKSISKFKDEKINNTNNIKKIFNKTLNELLGRQMLLANIHINKDEKINDINNFSGYKYKYNFKYKLASLLYLNHNTNYHFDCIFKLIANVKLKKIKSSKMLH